VSPRFRCSASVAQASEVSAKALRTSARRFRTSLTTHAADVDKRDPRASAHPTTLGIDLAASRAVFERGVPAYCTPPRSCAAFIHRSRGPGGVRGALVLLNSRIDHRPLRDRAHQASRPGSASTPSSSRRLSGSTGSIIEDCSSRRQRAAGGEGRRVRTFDADSASVAGVANVLCTLINDLETSRVIE
jgi:hypothetical protein